MNLPILLVNANALTASIFDAAIAGTVQHEIVKKDVDSMIGEVGREGGCVYEIGTVRVIPLFYRVRRVQHSSNS